MAARTDYGSNIFDVAPGNDAISFGNGSYGTISQNIVNYATGDGNVTINPNGADWGSGTIVMDSGITQSGVVFQADDATGNLVIRFLNSEGLLTNDAITVTNDLNISGEWLSEIDEIEFSDGTTLTLNSSMTSTWYGSPSNTTLVGTDTGNNVFVVGPGGDHIIFGNGMDDAGNTNNILKYNIGDGAVTINPNDVAWETGTIQFGQGITNNDIIFESDTVTGNLTISVLDANGSLSGDSVTILNEYLENWIDYAGVNYVGELEFADGSTLSVDGNITDTWFGSGTNANLVGSDYSANVFVLGASESTISVGAKNITFGNGSNGGNLENTVSYNLGDGAVVINPNNDSRGEGTFVFGAGITESDLVFESDNDPSSGNLTISVLGSDGALTSDQITIIGDIAPIYLDSSIGELAFSDGTTLDVSEVDGGLTSTWFGSSTNTNLIGSNYGPNLFNIGPGTENVTFGIGTFSASAVNIVNYDAGDGQIVIDPNEAFWREGTISFGSGITASDLVFESDNIEGNLTIAVMGADGTLTGDAITILNDLNIGGTPLSEVGELQFSDGSTMAIDSSLLNTWIGSSTNTTLTGSNSGTNPFELAPGNDQVTLGNGSSGGDGNNIIEFGKGDGNVNVDPNSGWASVQLAPNVQLSDVSLTQNNNGDIILSLTDDADQITFADAASSNALQGITLSNGFTLSAGQIYYASGAGTTGDDQIYAPSDSEMIDGRGGNDVIYNGGGYDEYVYRQGYGNLEIDNEAGNSLTASSELDFGVGITEQNLWFSQSGQNLDITVLGSQSQIVIDNWFGGNAGAQLAELKSYDGLEIDAGVNQLVAAMASFETNNPSFNPETAVQMPNDTNLQVAIAAAWHQAA